MDYLKKLFQKDDDNIPQIHLNKHEPKVTYDPVKKKWIIEGEPEEEEEKPNSPPPKIESKKQKIKNTNKIKNV